MTELYHGYGKKEISNDVVFLLEKDEKSTTLATIANVSAFYIIV